MGMQVVKSRLSISGFATVITATTSLTEAVTNIGGYFDSLPQGYSALLWVSQAVNCRSEWRKAAGIKVGREG